MIIGTRIRRRQGEAGYNMALLVIAITVLNILLAAAMPTWSYRIKKDKEEELRSRGLQYAEAIRIFRGRYGRQPTTLKELIEIKPRSIRKLWDDPMSETGEWGLIFARGGVGGNGTNPQNPQQQQQQIQNTVNVDPSTSADGKNRVVTVGPILGVYSLSDEDSLSSFFGKTTYKEWQFTADLMQRQSIGRPDQAGQLPRLEIRTFGRPFIPELQNEMLQPQMGGAPGQALVPNLPGQPGQQGGTFGQGGGTVGQPAQPNGGQPGFNTGNPRNQNPGVNPRSNPRPRNPRPGFPVQPGQPGNPTANPPDGGNPGGGNPGGGNPGGQPGGGGIDPTQPQNFSRSVFRPTPSNG